MFVVGINYNVLPCFVIFYLPGVWVGTFNLIVSVPRPARTQENQSLGFPTRSITNQPVQSQEKGWKLEISDLGRFTV